MYQVFTKDCWKIENGKKVPAPEAEKDYLEVFDTETEARECCKEYNSENEEGILSNKAEYQEVEDELCYPCRGSGEGYTDGSKCSSCGGSGVEK
jgi:hypothetical protein